jgi:hypothetical protein
MTMLPYPHLTHDAQREYCRGRNFNDWKFWHRALFVNVLGCAGVVIGFAFGVKVSPDYYAPIAIVVLVLFNFLFFVVNPIVVDARRSGRTVAPIEVAVTVLRERPLISLLVILQLVGTSRAATSAINFLHFSAPSYVAKGPNAATVASRMMAMSFVMAGVSVLWLLGAIGLWRNRGWGWWLAIVLNGLAAGVTTALQLLSRDQYLIDVFALVAVVLLILPSVREQSRIVGEPIA